MPLKTQQDEPPSLNLTPMIDVVFLLIIFFMAGTQFTSDERNLDVDVPRVRDDGHLPPLRERRVVNVGRDGVITLNRQRMSLDELVEELRQAVAEHPTTGVNVRGDGEGSFQNVATVLHACREAGVRDLSISVRVATRTE